MPHPEHEHALQIALATALRERDDLRAELSREQARNDVRMRGSLREYEEQVKALAAANARAEKAEKDLRYEANRSDIYAAEVSRLEKTHDAAQEALAAARRECEAMRKALEPFAKMADRKDDWPANSDCAHFPSMAQVRAARAALAAPGDGEEGKR